MKPTRTTRSRSTKVSKENSNIPLQIKLKNTGKVEKPPRKVLGDKTNSTSDDNVSQDTTKKFTQKTTLTSNVFGKENHKLEDIRSRRQRKLPVRYQENNLLKSVSTSTDGTLTTKPSKLDVCDTKSTSPNEKFPVKTPEKHDSSIIASRPKRVCRLPSKFDDHTISPHKFIPVTPCHSSTPKVVEKKHETITRKPLKGKDNESVIDRPAKEATKSNKQSKKKEEQQITEDKRQKVIDTGVVTSNIRSTRRAKVKETLKDIKKNKASSDTNNNAKQSNISQYTELKKSPINKTPVKKTQTDTTKNFVKPSPSKINSTKTVKSPTKRIINQNFSFRILEKRKSPRKTGKVLDIYEFTFDPSEEPPRPKKKKRAPRKPRPKVTKPKTVILKSNYAENVSKALKGLKDVVSKKSHNKHTNEDEKTSIKEVISQSSKQFPIVKPSSNNITANGNTNVISNNITEVNNASVRIEDIAAHLENTQDHVDIDYSPVNSPNRPPTPAEQMMTHNSSQNHHDPLNLREELSFFDDYPVASSSINVSTRHPGESPWRVDFDQLPIKWHVNAHIKPNMTPAVESSYTSFDGKKKHVYTNIFPETVETLPEVVEDSPKLVQTSIISFIKEVVERSAKKKAKADHNRTPTKNIPEKGQIAETSNNSNQSSISNVVNTTENTSNDNITTESRKRKNSSDENIAPAKTPRKDNKDVTFFGFDDSEDLENLSPTKKQRVRALRPKARAVLKEINQMSGPMRAQIPLAAKSKALNTGANSLFDEIKSATDAPITNNQINLNQTTNVNENTIFDDMANDDSQSVHLFEDIEVIHHSKPVRKSYGKAKKVTFRQASTDDSSDTQNPVNADDEEEEDNAFDLTFELPNEKSKKKMSKKKIKKKKISKKEEAEVEAWAAGFNSMCEDVEGFDLVVE